jgi:HD-like signal output (HDOD) protein
MDSSEEGGEAPRDIAAAMVGIVTALPADPDILRALKEELASSTPIPDTVTRLILRDPAIAIPLAQCIYSVQQGINDPPSLTNPWQMVVRLGMERTRQLLDTVGARPLPPTPLRPCLIEQRERAVRIAQFCRSVVRTVNPSWTDTGELVGLFGGIGNMLALLTLRDRFIDLIAETPNYAKATYRLLKEYNFNSERITADFLRLNGIPDRLVTLTEREGRAPGQSNQVELKTSFLAALELSNAFEEGRQALYTPGKTLPVMSSLRLLQLKDPVYAKLYAELVELYKLVAGGEAEAESVGGLVIAPPLLAEPLLSDGGAAEAPSSQTTAGDPLAARGEADVQALVDLEVKPISGLAPSEARIKRIQRLRTRAAQNPQPLATKPESLVMDSGVEAAVETISSLVRENSIISGCIRGIRNAEMLYGKGHLGKVRDLAVAVIAPITDRVARYQATLYFGAKCYYPHLLEGRNKVPLVDALGMLLPSELSSIIALTYLSEQLKPHCDKKEWENVMRQLRIHTELGRLVGATVPDTNSGTGMLVAGVRYMGMLGLLAKDPEGFAVYRGEMRTGRRICDLAREQEEFGVSHLELAAVMLQRLGFGAQLAGEVLPSAFTAGEGTIPKVLRWVESIHLSGSPFTLREYAPSLGVRRPELVTLRDKSHAVLEASEPCSWLMRDKSDLIVDGKCRLPAARS